MIPKLSPFSLIQEHLFPNDWLILVSCLMLNCTKRAQVEKVLPTFVARWPTPQAFMSADDVDVATVCRSLGFANKRTATLKRMTRVFLCGNWEHARELPGIGEYGARTWEIFCRNELGDSSPVDHALSKYFVYRRQLEQRKEDHR